MAKGGDKYFETFINILIVISRKGVNTIFAIQSIKEQLVYQLETKDTPARQENWRLKRYKVLSHIYIYTYSIYYILSIYIYLYIYKSNTVFTCSKNKYFVYLF